MTEKPETEQTSSDNTQVNDGDPQEFSNSEVIAKLTSVDDCIRSLRKEIALLRSNSFTLNHVIENVETQIRNFNGKFGVRVRLWKNSKVIFWQPQ